MHPAALDDLPATPATHFRLYFYAAVIELVREAAVRAGSLDALLERHGFVATYLNELAERGLEGGTLEQAGGWWRQALEDWERSVVERLPLRELRRGVGLDHESMVLLLGAGLPEEDPRLALLFDGAGAAWRPSASLLCGWFSGLEAGAVRSRIRRLARLGLLQVGDLEAPFPAWLISCPAVLWEAMRDAGAANPDLGWAKLRPRAEALPLEALSLPDEARTLAERVAELLQAGEIQGVVVRSAHHNGRRALLAALAHRCGKSLLEVRARDGERGAECKLAGPLALLRNAMPAFVLDARSGEAVALPELACECGGFGAVLGPRSGLASIEGRQLVTVELPMPALEARRSLWRAALGDAQAQDLDALAESLRMTSGNICRVGGLARAQARLRGGGAISMAHAQAAARQLDRSSLELLAMRVSPAADWGALVLDADTRAELSTLEARCKNRERLCRAAGNGSPNCGVRVLLRGPSGTGKTMAAGVLAAALGKDLYRIDLSTVVNKYIGETEKNLDRALSCAEELDVVLLFDEGDALFAQRTGVHSSNDRYANLETNFLLQRIEAYEGILLITTNLAEHIDAAFQRRIDAMVDFRMPQAQERLAIFALHLPDGHQVSGALLEEVAGRCSLSGGQIRNAVLHASLVAFTERRALQDAHLEAAVRREYRKAGAICPLRSLKRAVLAAS